MPDIVYNMEALVLIIIIAIALLFSVLSYNRLIYYRNEVKNAWHGMDVQLKRRHDLIANILELVAGYASHERRALDLVIEARRKAQTVLENIEERVEAEKALSASFQSLLIQVEAYPHLKASEGFAVLMAELTATENKIGLMRQYYNDMALRYKNRVEMFPGNIVAGLFNFRPEPFFLLEDEQERIAPQVK